jgi:hypothetical protein
MNRDWWDRRSCVVELYFVVVGGPAVYSCSIKLPSVPPAVLVFGEIEAVIRAARTIIRRGKVSVLYYIKPKISSSQFKTRSAR